MMALWHTVKNIGATLAGSTWSSLLGLVTLPVIVRGFGAEAYGLLSLSLSVVGVASICDLGIGRALSKCVAEEGDAACPGLSNRSFHTALSMTLSLAAASTAVFALITPLLVTKVFHVEARLMKDTTLMFFFTAAAVPAVLVRILLDGILVGRQRIAVMSAVNAGINTLKIGAALATVLCRGPVHVLVLSYCVISYLHLAAFGWLCFRGQSPIATLEFAWEPDIARQLLRLGSLSTVANASGYFFLYLDRWIIAVFLSMNTLGYYAVAFDIASRQCYLGNAIGQAFFPVFAKSARVSREALTGTYLHAGMMMVVAGTGLGVIMASFAQPLLSDWISVDMGAHAAPLLTILAIGAVLSCYFNIPATTLLAGSGRPEIIAVQFALGAVTHLAICMATIEWLGAAGVALGVTGAYVVMLWGAHSWLARVALSTNALPRLRNCIVPCWALALAVAFPLSRALSPMLSHTVQVLAAMGLAYAVYIILALRVSYSATERSQIWQQALSLIPLRLVGAHVKDC